MSVKLMKQLKPGIWSETYRKVFKDNYFRDNFCYFSKKTYAVGTH